MPPQSVPPAATAVSPASLPSRMTRTTPAQSATSTAPSPDTASAAGWSTCASTSTRSRAPSAVVRLRPGTAEGAGTGAMEAVDSVVTLPARLPLAPVTVITRDADFAPSRIGSATM